MRRILALFTMLMLCGLLASAQNRVVSGKVTDKDGTIVPFASVKVKGTRIVTAADGNGAYTIKVKDGDVLEISAAGFKAVEVAVGSLSFINSALDKTGNLTEVVVTSAFGIKRNARSSASNVQNVNAEQLNTVRQTSLNNALAGKVAGAQVRSQSSAALGKETTVRLRGENGLGIGGGALYVVDGTIVTSANDINVDDIEDVTVLQGPSAAALFGAEGANGAIVINTKRAKKGQKNLGIELNSGVQFDKVYVLPNYQNEYAGGSGTYNGGTGTGNMKKFTYVPGFHPTGWAALDGKYYLDYEEDESWGPRMVGQEYIPWYAWYGGTENSFKTAKLTPQPNNARDYFNTGVTLINNVNFSKGGDNYNFRASYTNQDIKGLIPTSYLRKNTYNINASFDIDPKVTVAANITYLNQNTNSENDDGYSNNTTGSFNQWFHRDIDINMLKSMSGFKTPEGTLATWNHGNPERWDPANPRAFYGAVYWFSPFSWQENVVNANRKDRLYGDVSISYKPTSDLKFKFTYRKQQLNSNSEVKQYRDLENSTVDNRAGFNYFETVSNRAAIWQSYGLSYLNTNRQNFEFLTSYSKKIKDFAVNANLGLDILKTERREFAANTMGGLVIPDVFTLSNSKNNLTQGNAVTLSGRRAVFVRADVGYKNYLFVEGAFRRDYSSTEQQGYGINTKSVGMSFVFSELLKNELPFLSYGKLRASTGEILNTLAPYQNSSLYGVNAQQWNGNLLQSELDRLIDPRIHGAANSEKELGVELRFLKNKIGVSATYWERINKDFPFNVSIYGGTGYSSLATNAGEIKKSGIDIQFNVNPIRTRNFDWNLTATWGRLLENKVISIAPGIERLVLQSAQAGTSAYLVSQVGQEWGQLRGIGFKRINGVPVIDADGFYVDEPEVNFGSTLPDFTGGVQNGFSIFKNFTLNVNIDYSFGGKFFSLSDYYGTGTGLWSTTAGLNDKGIPVRDNVADGGGVHVQGVDAETNKPVDRYVEARAYFQQFSYGAGIAEPYIKDLTFVKMRELSFGYRVPVKNIKAGRFLNSATFSIVVRNPWLIYSKAKGFDPSEISTESGEDGQLPGTRSIGINLKLGF
ncbi:MAG: SusC/RagA family TonB-linked outer membrane protein [Chitinophagaceae bacterium]|nr:SusC/RagA family TonB-linked outer membrane protein [Chitinophagaceae bacterium]